MLISNRYLVGEILVSLSCILWTPSRLIVLVVIVVIVVVVVIVALSSRLRTVEQRGPIIHPKSVL